MQVRMMKEERLVAEGALEEARSKEMEQRSRADGLKQDLDLQRAQVQRHLTQVCHLLMHQQASLLFFLCTNKHCCRSCHT